MNWELISHYAVPPLVGAVIGYFTNMIAVKMLFFPHEEKRIFGWRVPFTPGAIPKGKARLAKSAGRIVQNELFTREDISGKLLTEEVEKPLKKYDRLEKNFIELLETKITEAIHKMDIPGVVKDEGSRMIKEQAQGSRILRLLVSDSLVDTVMGSVGEKMEEFIDTRGPAMVNEITESRIHDLGNRTPLHVLELAGYNEEYVRKKITEAYRESVVNAVNSALKRIDVASIVEDKINSMSVAELEKGVMMVMKNELNMIVSLGGLIGLVIGCINIFI